MHEEPEERVKGLYDDLNPFNTRCLYVYRVSRELRYILRDMIVHIILNKKNTLYTYAVFYFVLLEIEVVKMYWVVCCGSGSMPL